jgi:hypothetical protein
VRAAAWILSGAAVFVVTVVVTVVLLFRSIAGASERSNMERLLVQVRAVHSDVLQERRTNKATLAHRPPPSLAHHFEHRNPRLLSATSDGPNLTLEVLVWTEAEAEFDTRPTLVTCLRVTSTPSTVRTIAIPCRVDTSSYGRLVTTITPLTDVVAVPSRSPRAEPCYSGSGRCN